MPGLLPLLHLIVPWFVVSLIMPGLLPLLQLMVPWFVVFLLKPGLLSGFIRETTNHDTMSCKRGNKPGIIRDNKPQHNEVQERQQTRLFDASCKAWFISSLAAHSSVVSCLSYKAWFVAFLIKPGWLPLLHLIVLWFVVSLMKPGLLPFL
jgi:hypothetical protein